MADERKRFYKRPVFFIPVIIVAVPGLWLAWWLGSPLFLNKTVDEPPPVGVASATRTAEPTTTEVPAPDKPAPVGEPVAAPIDVPATPAATTFAPDSTEPPASKEPAALALLSGMFKDADSRHKGSGDATIYELADGTRVLRLENIDITNGPDLHVFLSPVADASERGDVMADGYLDLGGLKGNRGNQNYTIEGNFDPEKEWTVVIYCVPFHVIFTTAALGAP